MSKLSQFLGKETVEVIDGVEFKIKSLTVNDLDLFADVDKNDVQGSEVRILKRVCYKILTDNFPDATPEELDAFPLEKLIPVVQRFMDSLNLGMTSPSNGSIKSVVTGAKSIG